MLESALTQRISSFEAYIFSYEHQQALNIDVTILRQLNTPWLKNHTLQNIVKFQYVKFEYLQSYIQVLNENMRI